MNPLNYLLLDFKILQNVTSQMRELLYYSLQKILITLGDEKQFLFAEMKKASLGE